MKFINAGARPGQRHVDSDAVFTIPNVLTVLRFMGVPLFIWLVLGQKEYALAALVLVIMGSTDWVDGYIARRFNQTSRLGRIMDPIADRLALIAVAFTLVIAGVVQWWYLTALVVPDAILAGRLALSTSAATPTFRSASSARSVPRSCSWAPRCWSSPNCPFR